MNGGDISCPCQEEARRIERPAGYHGPSVGGPQRKNARCVFSRSLNPKPLNPKPYFGACRNPTGLVGLGLRASGCKGLGFSVLTALGLWGVRV